MKPEFKFSKDDIISFPDMESEYVDVGIGEMKVAETGYRNLFRVVKRGRGLSLQLADGPCSETFPKYKRKGKNKDIISLKQYLEYFGDFNDLEYICSWEDFNLLADEIEEKYNI